MVLTTRNRFSSTVFNDGVYINLVSIKDAEDISGTIPDFLNRPIEIGIKLYLDIGKDFYPELNIFGDFEKDAISGEVTGWGSAFTVQEALYKLGYRGHLNDDNSIPEEAIQSLIGKQFFRLAYVSGSDDEGKLKYSYWNIIGTIDDSPEVLAKRFYNSTLKGYPTNYRPDLV